MLRVAGVVRGFRKRSGLSGGTPTVHDLQTMIPDVAQAFLPALFWLQKRLPEDSPHGRDAVSCGNGSGAFPGRALNLNERLSKRNAP